MSCSVLIMLFYVCQQRGWQRKKVSCIICKDFCRSNQNHSLKVSQRQSWWLHRETRYKNIFPSHISDAWGRSDVKAASFIVCLLRSFRKINRKLLLFWFYFLVVLISARWQSFPFEPFLIRFASIFCHTWSLLRGLKTSCLPRPPWLTFPFKLMKIHLRLRRFRRDCLMLHVSKLISREPSVYDEVKLWRMSLQKGKDFVVHNRSMSPCWFF